MAPWPHGPMAPWPHGPMAPGVGHEAPRGAQRRTGAHGRPGAAQPAGHADDSADGAVGGGWVEVNSWFG